MIERLLETFFRHKLLLLLPPIILPLIVGPITILRTPTYYEVNTGIWVDRPTYLTYSDDSNRYLTPAQNQSQRMNEVLRTRAFVSEVARATSMAPLVGTPKGDEQIQQIIGRGLSIQPNGNNLLVVRFRADTAQLAFDVINAVVDTYKTMMLNDRLAQAEVATAFYGDRLKTAQEQLAKSNDAIRRYVAGNPRLSGSAPASDISAAMAPLTAAATDSRFEELRRRQRLDQDDVERARTSLDKVAVDAAAARQGQDLDFRIVDAPSKPTAPSREQYRKMLIFPVAALALGLGLSATLLVLLAASDRSVRSQADLALTVRVLGLIPHLSPEQVPHRVGAEATRRAIGLVDGAVSPAPQAAK